RAGLHARQGGLTGGLGVIAASGRFDRTFFNGNVPRGPAISTALPFIPQRDLSRLIRDRASAVAPDTTLQDVVQFAAVPSAETGAAFALSLDGSNPTIDAAVVNSQTPVAVPFPDNLLPPRCHQPPDAPTLGTPLPP